MGCCHAARQEKQEKRPRSTTPSSTTVRDAAVSLSLAASSQPFEECVCGSCWYIIQYKYIPPNKAILSILWDSTPCTQVPRSRHMALTHDAQTVVRTERTPLIETPGSDPCSTEPRSTARDSRSAATCTAVGGEGRQPAAGAAKACRPRRRPSWREGSLWARQVRERAAESADGPCRCGCYPWGRPYAGCGDARDARAASGCLGAGRAPRG